MFCRKSPAISAVGKRDEVQFDEQNEFHLAIAGLLEGPSALTSFHDGSLVTEAFNDGGSAVPGSPEGDSTPTLLPNSE